MNAFSPVKPTMINHLQLNLTRYVAVVALAATTAVFPTDATPSLGLQTDIVSENSGPGDFSLVRDKHAAPLFLDGADYAGVLRAARICRPILSASAGSSRLSPRKARQLETPLSSQALWEKAR